MDQIAFDNPTFTALWVMCIIISTLIGRRGGFKNGVRVGQKSVRKLQESELATHREAGRLQGIEEGRKIGFIQGRQAEKGDMIGNLIQFMEDGIRILKDQSEGQGEVVYVEDSED